MTGAAARAILGERAGLEPLDLEDVNLPELEGYEGLIVGCPTWNTNAAEYRSGTAWDDCVLELRTMELGGKPVAVFGCGDSVHYGNNFCDAIEEIHSAFQAAGARMIGYVDAAGYRHQKSKSMRDGKFLGLALDKDNEDDLTEGRIAAWVEQLGAEGMPQRFTLIAQFSFQASQADVLWHPRGA